MSPEKKAPVGKLSQLKLEELLQTKVNLSSTWEKDVFTAPSSVTVIDKEMIREHHFQTIGEALAIVAGFDVYSTIIDRGVVTSRGILQGFYANKVLLMINNIPTWQSIYGNGIIDRIDINDVQRIEVLKGAASVLYGSNAYTGAVNIVFHEKKGNRAGFSGFARFGGGDYGMTGTNVQVNKGKFRLFLSANTGKKTFSPYKTTSAKGYFYGQDSVYLYTPKEEHTSFNVVARYESHRLMCSHFHYNHSYLGIHPSFIGGGGQMVMNNGLLVNYSFDKNFKRKTLIKFYVSYDRSGREFSLSQDKSIITQLAAGRYDMDLKVNYKFDQYLTFEAGGKYEIRENFGYRTYNGIVDTLLTDNMNENKGVQEWSTFAQVLFNLKPFQLLLGTRYTENSLFGENLSSRAVGILQFNSKNSLKLIYNQSFRAPTLLELYFNHPTVVGNKNLQPELVETIEAAYLTRLGEWYVNLLGYYSGYSDLIARQEEEDNSPGKYTNMKNFSANGVELEIKYRHPRIINFFLNYNTNLSIDDNGDKANFRFVPDHTISLGVSKAIENWKIGSDGRWYSGTEGHLTAIPTQYLLNLHTSFSHYLSGIKLNHRLSARNLTNSKLWVPEYIRKKSNINRIRNLPYGRTFVYSLLISI